MRRLQVRSLIMLPLFLGSLLTSPILGLGPNRPVDDPPLLFYGSIAWAGPISCPVSSGYAVRYGAPAPPDCPLWLIMVPPSEGGDISEQMNAYNADPSRYAGVFLDDYYNWGSMYPGSFCPVLYADMAQPAGSVGAKCIVLVIPPSLLGYQGTVQGWKDATLKAEQRFKAGSIMLLLYYAPYSHWRQPIPTAYILGVYSAAKSLNQTLVVFN